MRALKAPGSRHAILRFRFNACKASIGMDTLPKVMSVAFPDVRYDLSKTDWICSLPNGSEIWLGGLDDKERTEKILGQEFATIYLNECSQIPYTSRGIALTRLAQKVMQEIAGRPPKPLRPRMYYDCNPPGKGHWSYKLFHDKIDPETKRALPDAGQYAWIQINPSDNAANVDADYLESLKSLPPRLQKRFLRGEWADETPNQLFADETIDKWRADGGELPDMVRIVIAVDPSGSDDVDNADNDSIGIVVAGLAMDGNAYVLEDCTVKAGPATWGRLVASAFDRHDADIVVGEDNFGGAMVKHTIKTANPKMPYKSVKATRGKAVRAEPISALYETGKVRHAGRFVDLEDELTAFSTYGYTGSGSPNRADALVWAIYELFPGLTKKERAADEKKRRSESSENVVMGDGAWMA